MTLVIALALCLASATTACSSEVAPDDGMARAGSGEEPVHSPGTPQVRILYDRFRIPHVFAVDDAGAFFGLGYSQARDFPVATLANLWSATGRFGEVAGAMVLERDRRLVARGIPERAEAFANDPDLLEPETRFLLEAYIDGVNAGRRLWQADPALVDALQGAAGETWFDPVPPWLDPRIADDDLRARLDRLFSQHVELSHVLSLGLALNAGIDLVGGGYSRFTNVWTIRNGREAGNTLMLVDSHQPLKRGGVRSYFVQVHGDTYQAAGYTMPGYPCITLGFNDDLAYGVSSMPKVPKELLNRGVPFRLSGSAPVARGEWQATLEPDLPPRFVLDDGRIVALEERSSVLRYWDVEAGALRDDPSGPFVHYRVPEPAEGSKPALSHTVIAPEPGRRIDPTVAREIRYDSWSYTQERSLWEFWIRAARSRNVGPDGDGIGGVLADVFFCYGRGLLFNAIDARGGLEFLWMSRVPVPGEAALRERPWRERVPTPLDGADPATRWRGFHGVDDLPHFLDRSGFDERAEVWISTNCSPHFVRAAEMDPAPFSGPDHIMETAPWKSRRQDRARELLQAAAADGEVTVAELERVAVDVQDPWARSMWPLLQAVGGTLDSSVSGFVAWIDRFRFEAADGTPGDEPFIAHRFSQVTVFTTLIRARFEAALLSLEDLESHEVELAFDPLATLPDPASFASEERWGRCRALLGDALRWAAGVRDATLKEAPGGLTNRAFLERVRTELSGRDLEDPWSTPLYREQAQGWGPDAPAVVARWGEVHMVPLTPHQVPPRLRGGFERSIWSMLLPELTGSRHPFQTAQRPRVLPIGGTRNTLFQLQRSFGATAIEALYPRASGFTFLIPVDLGSQITYLVELRDGEPARARFLSALGSTEITTALPSMGIAAGDHFRPTTDFEHGIWNDLVLDLRALEASPGISEISFDLDRRGERLILDR